MIDTKYLSFLIDTCIDFFPNITPIFQRGNFNRFNIIFLRNVLIYFQKHTVQRVIEKMSRYLLPGGFLFVGHTEMLEPGSHNLKHVGPAIYQKP